MRIQRKCFKISLWHRGISWDDRVKELGVLFAPLQVVQTCEYVPHVDTEARYTRSVLFCTSFSRRVLFCVVLEGFE